MIRAVLLIIGDVQAAGYRAFIMKAAQKFSLEGNAENLPDGRVRAICEAEKELIDKFIDSIKIKDEMVNVESIEIKYEAPTGEFKGKGFTVKVPDFGYELFQGFATADKYFKTMFKKQDQTIEEIKVFRKESLEKQDQTIGEIKALRLDLKSYIEEKFAKIEHEI
ncbi:MAG: acylphosphatase, partial [Euryarchaeota archaeon]|nr:acylphosphatase [Euryarchaeota archaeon]